MSNYAKLKTNLKLAIQRLKLLEKKKTELSLKSRKEIADYLAINKVDRARIKVEHIIREDNYVEAMEMLEMFCDILLARFGLIEKMKELDPGLDESIATIIWASPRISSDILEFKTIAEILSAKYGRKYAEACKADSINNVNEKVKKRLGLEAPPKILVEQYLIEIAKNFNVAFVPDNNVMLSSGLMSEELISLRDTVNEITRNNSNNNNSNNAGGSGGSGGQTSYQLPSVPQQTASNYHTNEKPHVPIGFNENHNVNLIDLHTDHNNNTRSSYYPPLPGSLPVGDVAVKRNSSPPAYEKDVQPEMDENDYDNAPALPQKTYNQSNEPDQNEYYQTPPPSYNTQDQHAKVPQAPAPAAYDEDELVLPSVPVSHFASAPDPNASIEFDDLAKRFENLKNFK